MKFSRSTTYGLRALANLLLAKADDASSVKSLKVVAQEENISLKYLEQLVAKLKRVGIVNSTRGVNGGYYIDRKAEDVSLLEILESLGEKTIVFQCINKEGVINCGHSSKCGAVPVLQRVQIAVNKSLEKMTLKDLI